MDRHHGVAGGYGCRGGQVSQHPTWPGGMCRMTATSAFAIAQRTSAPESGPDAAVMIIWARITVVGGLPGGQVVPVIRRQRRGAHATRQDEQRWMTSAWRPAP